MRRYRILLIAALAPLAALRAEPPAAAPSPELAAAREHFTARRDTEAQAAFERILAADPANHEAVYHLGRLAKRRGDWPAVAEFYERCTILAPAEALYWADLGEAYGKLAGKAGIFKQLGLARRCRAALEKAVALAPDNLDYRRGLLEFCEKAPSIAGGGRDKALAQAAEIAKRDAYAGALATGGIHARAKNWAAAEIAFAQAARLRPAAIEPPSALGLLYAEQERYADALVQFDQALARNPDDFAVLYQIGRVAALSGLNLAEGETALRRYLAQPAHLPGLPTNAHAQFRLGDILARRGDTAAARAAYEEALRLDPALAPAAEALAKLKP
jgi:tetratricopeptide (TPR) repeat protein